MIPIRKPSTAANWHPLTPATENAILDMANARQIALRTRLQLHYWLTECRPLTPTAVAQVRKKMAMIDPRDVLDDEEVQELLTEFFGFTATDAGLTIPDLDEHRRVSVGAAMAFREKQSEAGRKRASEAARSGGRFVKASAEDRAQDEADPGNF